MIRTRLTVWNCTILSLVLAVIGLAIYFTTRQTVYKAIDSSLTQRAHAFAAGWHGSPRGGPNGGHDPGGGPPPGGPPPINVDAAKAQGIDPQQARRLVVMNDALRPMILGLDGKDVIHKERRPWSEEGFLSAKEGLEVFGEAEYDGISLRVLSVPLRENGKVTAVTQMASPIAAEEEQLGQLAKILGIVLPLAVVVMMVTGVVLTRQALRPVAEIAEAAEAIEATNLSERLPVHGRDEFAQLSGTFNTMLSRLKGAFDEKDEAFARQQRFTADASHELKTPLTAIRARTGIAMRKPDDAAKLMEHIRAIDRAATLMTSVVQDLLLLTASDEGRLQLKLEEVTVKDLVDDALASADTASLMVTHDIDPSLKLRVDSSAITRVLVNLLQNAVLHTEAGKTIHITARSGDERTDIVVRDEGCGIPPSRVDLVFDRFHRVDESRDRESGGSGLGLAIAKAIVEAHSGRIALTSEVGKGTTVTVSLPS